MTNAELEDVVSNLYQLSVLQGRMLATHRVMIDALLVIANIDAPPLLREINELSEELQHTVRDQLKDRFVTD